MSLDEANQEMPSYEREKVDGILGMSPEEVLDISEPEYRRKILRQRTPLTKPMVQSVENSVGRERKRLEDVYQNESGADKWLAIWEEIGPRWADILAELDRRSEDIPGATKPLEESYTSELKEEFDRTLNLSRGLDAVYPKGDDVRRFVESYRELEDVYEREVHPNLDHGNR